MRRSSPSTCWSRSPNSRAAWCRACCARSTSIRRRSPRRRATTSAKQPKAHGGAEPHLSPRLRVVLDAAQAEAKAMQDEFVSTEHLLLGLLGEPGRSPSRRPAEGARACRASACSKRLTAVRGSQRVTDQNPEGKYEALREVRPRSDRAGAQGQARSGDRPRRGSAPRDPGAVAPHQEQSRADRRTRRRQDRDRRRPRAAHRPRRRARRPEETSRSSRSTWGR